MEDNRRPLSEYSNYTDGFVFASEDGTKKIKFIEVIGSGGTGLAYKCIMKENNVEKFVVIKEYYPDETGISPQYIREDEDGRLYIQADNDEERIEELKRQKENVKRELDLNHELYLRNDNNNPYMYNAEFFCTYGDSSYVLIDTSDGCTLKNLLNGTKYADMSDRQRIELAINYTKRFLIILNHIFSDKYVHGDIKPENIYIAGDEGAEHIYFLDYGSVFCLNEYKIDLDNTSDEEVIRIADKVIWNEGIGMSSEGYRNAAMVMLLHEKNNYFAMKGSVSSAQSLLQAINNIDISVDLYSLIKIFYYISVGEEYLDSMNRRKLKNLLGDCDIIAEDLQRIMRKNEDEGYHSIDEVETELDIISALLNKEGHPKVLLYGIQKQMNNIEVDEKLFGKVQVE